MTIFRSARVYAIAGAAVLAIGLVGGAALAREGDGPPPSAEHAGRPHFPYIGLRAIVGASGLDFEVFRAGFAEDKSINTILEENGVDPAEVKQAVLEKLQEKLDQAVANGRITEDEAAAIYERASEHLDTLMSSTPDDLPRPHRAVRGAIRDGLETAAGVIGIAPLDLVRAIHDGQTIAEVAGGSSQAVIDALVAEADARIEERAAERGLSEDEVAELKARAEERITTLVNEGGPRHHGERGMRGG